MQFRAAASDTGARAHLHLRKPASSTSFFCLPVELFRRKVLCLLPCLLFFCKSATDKLQKTTHLLFLRTKKVLPSYGMLFYHLILANFLLYYIVALEYYSNNIGTRKCNNVFHLTCEFSFIWQIYMIFARFMKTSSEYIAFDIARPQLAQAMQMEESERGFLFPTCRNCLVVNAFQRSHRDWHHAEGHKGWT